MNYLYITLGVLFVLSIIMFIVTKNKTIKVLSGTLLSIVISVLCAISFKPLLNEIKYGLDLQGGFEVLYEVSPLDNKSKLDSTMVSNTYKALLKRIDILGVSEPEITIEGDNRIRVKLAGITNEEEARNILSSTASLTFRDYNDNLLMTSDVLGGNAKVTRDDSGRPAVSLNIKDTDTFYNVTNRVSKMNNNLIVIWLDYQEGKDSYSNEKENCGSLSDSRCLSAATVSQGFASNVIISGNFTDEEVTSLVELINSGALPTKLEELSSRTVEASFGENSLNKTLYAGLLGISIVALIMILVYKFSGFIAAVGIILYTILTFLIFYLIGGVLTLSGIAAMLLGIGMAVDANVISFERVKERLRIGEDLNKSFNEGHKSSLTSIIDSNITTLIVAIILFIFGESSVKGFATMLMINIAVTIIVMVVFVKFILKLFVNTNFFNDKLYLFAGVKKKQIKPSKEIRIPLQKLEFVKNRRVFFTITALIIIISFILGFNGGLNLGVDFTGGTKITVNTNETVNADKLEQDLKELSYNIKKKEFDSNSITITIEEVLNKDSIEKLKTNLEDKYKTDTDIYTVSKVVKQQLTKNAIYSLIIASVGILLYISIRFKFNYAIAAIIALIHDVCIVTLFFADFNIEITTLFIAAILTIIGYSINDTIVTFDMIRENYKYRINKKKETIKEERKSLKKQKIKDKIVIDDKFNSDDLINLVNDSVRLTFFRSILTTITTIVPVICLIILGAHEIINFNIALLVGFIAGVYSSIYISNQIWLILETKSIKKGPKKVSNDDDEVEELKIKGINC